MPGWLDNAFHSHRKRHLVALATDGLLARAISYCGDQLSDGFVEDAWVQAQLLDGMLRPKQRAEVIELALKHQVLERVFEGETREIFGSSRGGLRTKSVRVEVGPFPADGYIVHDYLDCNRSRAEIDEIRAAERQKKREQRSGRRQEQLPWNRFRPASAEAVSQPVSPGDSPPESRGDSGDRDRTGTAKVGETVMFDARATERAQADVTRLGEVVAILGEAQRLRVDDDGVLNAMRAFPTVDPVLAAREVVAKFGNDPTRWQSFGSRLLWEVLEARSVPPATAAAQRAFTRRDPRRPSAADFDALIASGELA